MVRKLFIVMGIGLPLTFILVATLNVFYTAWVQSRFFPSPTQYGDLYNLTNLRAFKERSYITQSSVSEADLPPLVRRDSVHLYLFGDSFINRIPANCYGAGQTEFERVGVSSREVILNKDEINILIIENVERGIADRFSNKDYFNTFIENAGYYTPKAKRKSDRNASVNVGVWGDFGGSAVEERLQLLLGNYRPVLLLKEAKAWINLWLFDKVDGSTVLSHDGKHLFYYNEASRTVGPTSSFYSIGEELVAEFITNMETIEKHYLDMGFDQVYFALIPNKASILAPQEGYNRLIPRMQQQAAGRLAMIDMYSRLQNTTDTYHLGDGHWNKKGMRLWLEEVNKVIRQVQK